MRHGAEDDSVLVTVLHHFVVERERQGELVDEHAQSTDGLTLEPIEAFPMRRFKLRKSHRPSIRRTALWWLCAFATRGVGHLITAPANRAHESMVWSLSSPDLI